MRPFWVTGVMAVAAMAAVGQQPKTQQRPAQAPELTLPPGFHATVVAEGLGAIRHLAVRANGDIYVSTVDDGILAVHQNAGHKADRVERFSAVAGGTGIGFDHGDLYASTSNGIYRFTFDNPNELVPTKMPQLVVEGLPGVGPGFRRANHPIAFDGEGGLYVSLDDSVNDFCFKRGPRAGAAADPAPRAGVTPCPDLVNHAGIWRFDANRLEQKFPAAGEQMATGVRDMTALAWSSTDHHLYGIMHGRDNMDRTFPGVITAQDQDAVSDEMDRVTKGTNFGWPYTYYNGFKNVRLVAPGYGGNGQTVAPAGDYATPVVAFTPRSAPESVVFYNGSNFPAAYHGGAFIALHGTRGKNGYAVVFVPWNSTGRAGAPQDFAGGFAQIDPAGQGPAARRPKYRPSGLAVGPGGALYIADSQTGRIWRVSYGQ